MPSTSWSNVTVNSTSYIVGGAVGAWDSASNYDGSDVSGADLGWDGYTFDPTRPISTSWTNA